MTIRAVQQLRAPGPRPSPRRPSLPGTGAAARQGPPSGAQWREAPDVSTFAWFLQPRSRGCAAFPPVGRPPASLPWREAPDVSTYTGKQLPSRPGERPTWQETPVVSTHIGLPLSWVMRRFATEGLPTGKSRQGPIPRSLPLTGRCSHRALAAIGRRDNGTVGRPPRERPHVALGVVRDCQYSAFLGSLPEGRIESGRMWLGTPHTRQQAPPLAAPDDRSSRANGAARFASLKNRYAPLTLPLRQPSTATLGWSLTAL